MCMDSEVWGKILVPNLSKLDQEGFQEVRTGRGSVLTEYEPGGRHGRPIHEGVCSENGYSFFTKLRTQHFSFFCGMSAAGQAV